MPRGTDYDIFLISRIREYRLRGMSERCRRLTAETRPTPHSQSIIYGLTKTGRLITLAGAIMFVAFAGLLFAGLCFRNAACRQLVQASRC